MSINVTPRGSRGARVPTRGPLAKLFKLVGKRQIQTYRRGGEERLSSRMGFPVVLLSTRGAKTGQVRTTPIGGFPDGANSWLAAGARIVATAPRYGKYQQKTDREIPIVRLTRES